MYFQIYFQNVVCSVLVLVEYIPEKLRKPEMDRTPKGYKRNKSRKGRGLHIFICPHLYIWASYRWLLKFDRFYLCTSPIFYKSCMDFLYPRTSVLAKIVQLYNFNVIVMLRYKIVWTQMNLYQTDKKPMVISGSWELLKWVAILVERSIVGVAYPRYITAAMPDACLVFGWFSSNLFEKHSPFLSPFLIYFLYFPMTSYSITIINCLIIRSSIWNTVKV